MRTSTLLLLGCSIFAATPAFAQNAPAAAPAADDAASDDDIVVYGRGETRQVQSLGATQIALLAPGTSPLKAIESLPGVNFQSADPFGAYEWSQRISIRGFNQNQLGFTFNGIPLGDGSYGNHNGLHVSRVVSPENVGRVTVSQGAGSLGTQSTNNLGGTIETLAMDPLDRNAIQINGTYGSENFNRIFVRANFGAPGRARGYISYSRSETDKWKGEGQQNQNLLNARLIVPIGDVNLDAWYSHSFRAEQDYQDLSLNQIARLGYNADNFGVSNYALALRVADIANNRGDTGAPVSNAAAGTVYPAPIATADDAYLDAAGIRRDDLASLGLTGSFGGESSFVLRGYYHANKGQGLWGTPYVPSPNGVPISIRTTEYDINRYGLFGSVEAPVGPTTLTVGGWWEQNDFNQARRFYALTSRSDVGRSFRQFQVNPFFTQWEFNFSTETLQYFVEDRIELGALTVNLGWKGFQVRNRANAVISGGRAAGNIDTTDWFQPHAGAVYRLGDSSELFAGFTQATRSYASATTAGPFATTQVGFDAIRNTLRPEQSDTYEVGYRFNGTGISAVLGAYYVNFRNRLLAFSNGAGIVGNPAILQNVGAVRSVGVEASVNARLGYGFNLLASYAYNESTYRNDVRNAAGTVIAAINGRTVVDSPRHIASGSINYDDGTFFGRLGGTYQSKRYFTYTNDQSVPGRVIADANVGARIDGFELSLNVTNLFDKDYVSTIGSNGFGNSGDNQTLLAGAPQQFFVTLRAGF